MQHFCFSTKIAPLLIVKCMCHIRRQLCGISLSPISVRCCFHDSRDNFCKNVPQDINAGLYFPPRSKSHTAERKRSLGIVFFCANWQSNVIKYMCIRRSSCCLVVINFDEHLTTLLHSMSRPHLRRVS